MKIGFNVKKIRESISLHIEYILGNTLQNHETRLQKIEGSEWVEITSSNGQEAEITQQFTEIRMLAKCSHNSYTVTCNYDSAIFHNTAGNGDTYLICGNPIENNYGCKFKYTKLSGKQYVCVDSCYNGGSQDAYAFRAWIKPVPKQTGEQ